MHDTLPERQEMIGMFEAADLSIERFIDESGFYLVLGRKGKKS
jgi:hypothetical protein